MRYHCEQVIHIPYDGGPVTTLWKVFDHDDSEVCVCPNERRATLVKRALNARNPRKPSTARRQAKGKKR